MLDKVTRKIQEKFGLTKSEAGIILFLSFGLILGGTAKILQLDKSTEKFDFSRSDSFFVAASSRIDSVIAAEEDTAGKSLHFGKMKGASVTSPVDLNSASLSDLVTIPGIGNVTAQRILDYRSANGKFGSVQELRNVKGIGAKKLEQMKPYVRVE
ncbi:MAG: helix-hairpin-helix domain-containing protein [Bacteroidetes bacterium]|nr:helix-hairpin-helix domain-containing protein [Bacteroidota bacterium]